MKNEKAIGFVKIKEHLLAKEGKDKIVVLFEDSVTKGRQSKSIGDAIKDDPQVSINRKVPFVIENNMLRLGDKSVVLGLRGDEKFLVGHYPEDIIRYYEEQEEEE